MKANLLQRHYKKKTSGFKQWDQLDHAEDYLIYPENIGENLSIEKWFALARTRVLVQPRSGQKKHRRRVGAEL